MQETRYPHAEWTYPACPFFRAPGEAGAPQGLDIRSSDHPPHPKVNIDMPSASLRSWSSVIALPALMAISFAAPAAKCDLKQDVSAQQGRDGPCGFDPASRSFAGTPAQQAACLTREVKRAGLIGSDTITPFLTGIVGRPTPGVDAVQTLLDARGILPEAVGGPLARPVSARYFIIHDTSTPNCSEVGASGCPVRGAFPPDRDADTWVFNRTFGGHPKPFPDRAAHAMTNRVGGSITEVDFADRIATTKFETCIDVTEKADLFIGVENIQPRVGSPSIPAEGQKVNDVDAPTPGFTSAQYRRLALLYAVASARRGEWLIPAFHAVLDQFYADGHDDPQHFDMAAFSAEIEALSDTLSTPTHE